MGNEKEKKFDENSSLGFMRFFVFYCVLFIVLCLMLMLFITGYTITFSPTAVSMLFSMISGGVSVWMVVNRLAVARKGIIILFAIDVAASVVMNMLEGETFVDALFGNIPTILWMIYFATSRRAKAVLVRPIDDITLGEFQESKDREMFDIKSKDFWLRMLMYFFIFCVVGHWMEAGFCRLVNAGIMPGNITPENSTQFRDSLNPFPIYGIGFCMCVLLLYPLKTFCLKKFKGNFVATFLIVYVVAMVIVGVAELVFGLQVNTDYSVWDYRNQPFNFMGQICLSYTAMFALAASVVVWVIYPILESMFMRVNKKVFRGIFVISLLLFAFLYVTYTLNLDEIFGVNVSLNGDVLDQK